MLIITPSTAKELIMPLAKQCKAPYSAGMYLYQAKDNDDLIAQALFEISGDTVRILHYESAPDEEHFMLDGVLRAGFNYAAEQGILQGEIWEAFRQKHISLFEHLNYPHESVFNIENFFSKYKNCTDGVF